MKEETAVDVLRETPKFSVRISNILINYGTRDLPVKKQYRQVVDRL
jgi:hypothetical protein